MNTLKCFKAFSALPYLENTKLCFFSSIKHKDGHLSGYSNYTFNWEVRRRRARDDILGKSQSLQTFDQVI